MGAFRVRRARHEDAEAFVAVVAAVAEEGRFLLTEPPVDRVAFARRVRRMLGEGRDTLWVLEEGERVVGTLGLHPSGAPGVVSLGMGVLAEARGRGGGRALLQAALDHARASRLAKVELEVFPDNAPAVALYAAHGFEVEGLRRRHYLRRDGSRRDVLLMARLLD